MRDRVKEIVRKEFLVTFREPRMRIMLIIPPLVQLIIFGYAVRLDVADSRLALLDRDQTPASRELAARFEGSTYFRITNRPATEAEVDDLIQRGSVVAALHFLPGFQADLNRGRTASVQVIVDGSDSNTGALVSGYISRIIAGYTRELRSPPPGVPQVSLRSRVWYNPDLRSQDYFVPGVLVNIIGLVTVMLTAMAVVREKEIGTMEQLMVTPIRPLELMLGKTIPFAIAGLGEMILITAASLIVFDIPFRGSATLLLAASLLFVPTSLGAGLLISTLSQTQQQAVMGTFFFFLPAFLLSGFAFPIPNMPEAVQYATCLNPLRYFLEVVRGVFLKGTGWPELWPQLAVMAAMGAATILFSAARFQKRAD